MYAGNGLGRFPVTNPGRCVTSVRSTVTELTRPIRRLLARAMPMALPSPVASDTGSTPRTVSPPVAQPDIAIHIADHDPLLAYLRSDPGPLDVTRMELDSPALRSMQEAGVTLVVPLVTHGELLGTLNLGPRLSDQEYSTDDRKLLEDLAAQAAPALRIAQLVLDQEAEVRDRERFEQELQVAQLIQQHFLPLTLPQPSGWSFQAHYRPARAVGGDFYDFVERGDGTLAFAIGDVTDKGVPAAMVMAATRSFLRAEGQDLAAPGDVLARVNELLQADMPPRMFVTCLYGVLDPRTGRIVFANAGHNLPIVRRPHGAAELRATGMPLGLLPGMRYEETQAQLDPGDQLVLHSDGIAEAHDPERTMFGIPRLLEVIGAAETGDRLLGDILLALERFTGPHWDQEDDITLVSLAWQADGVLARFELASEPGLERDAMDRVATAVEPLRLTTPRLEKLKTAVAEATMNAIEHGNHNDPAISVGVTVHVEGRDLVVRIRDEGGSQPIPIVETPDIAAKLAGAQSPRGWGLFLIQQMVDAVRVTTDGKHHITELVLHLEETPS
jgi:serine phosphatase RsbU (regulator of sigma subunit)/anti-sigma regulatory factor (Ser/Thr protein kinase)